MKFVIGIILVMLNMPLYYKMFWGLFEDMEDFKESVRYIFRWDFISLLKGQAFEDFVGEAKVGLFVFGCLALWFFEFIFLVSILGL